jgi:hypothetical protein
MRIYGEQRLGGGEPQLMLLSCNQLHAAKVARAQTKDQRQRGDEQRPLVDLARDQRPHARGGLAAPDEQQRHDELGGLRRERCEPLHEQELVYREGATRIDETVGEWLGRDEDGAARGPDTRCRPTGCLTHYLTQEDRRTARGAPVRLPERLSAGEAGPDACATCSSSGNGRESGTTATTELRPATVHGGLSR